MEVASGYRIQIRAAVAQPVSRLWQERPAKYSRALLETLALVAYRQPITRGEIEQIRGVAVNPNIIKTLLERSWIRVVGHRDVPGRPELLGTTREFLDYFSLKKLDDLPTLAQLKELEDLRVQLTLPGADPQVAAASGATDADGLPPTTTKDPTPPDAQRCGQPCEDAEGAAPRPPRAGRQRGAHDDRLSAVCRVIHVAARRAIWQTAAQAIGAAKGATADGAGAETAVGGRHRLAPRSRALDSRRTAADQRRSTGARAPS